MRRPARPSRGGVALLVGFVALVTLPSLAGAVPVFRTSSRQVTTTQTIAGKDGKTVTGASGTVGAGTSGSSSSGANAVVTKPGLSCSAGNNGGSTDKGVTGSKIKLAATVVRSGIGKAFLGDVPTSMKAAMAKINAQGGVCGRLLELKTVDDGWDPALGATSLRSLIAEDPFALAVVPSSEGLRVLIDSGDIAKAGIPVVGTDGMLIGQYTEPLVWPVAASTVSSMHIIANEAYKRGARTFGIVYESTYHFGVEGAEAFNASVKRLTGHDIPGYSPTSNPQCRGTFCGIQAGQSSYATSANTFNGECLKANAASSSRGYYESCDVVVLLLEPGTALTWIADGGFTPVGRSMAAQPLFNTDFAQACGARCSGLEAWSGYTPPLAPYLNGKVMQAYLADVRGQSSSVDVTNSFTIGGYVGMNLLIEALKQVGPNLTRENLTRVLDGMRYDSGLSTPLVWSQGNHFANGSMLSYKMTYSGSTFGGFQKVSDFVKDPWLGKDTDTH